MHFESPLLHQIPNIRHGYGTRSSPVPDALRADWDAYRAQWTQVAGAEIAVITEANQPCGDVDGFLTSTRFPIGIRAADCVPILLARRDGEKVAVLHAGWRGTIEKISERLAERLVADGENLQDWVASVGPAVGGCCYEVSESLIAEFGTAFPRLAPALISPAFRKLDLAAVNRAELERLGFGEVEVISTCTFCAKDSAGQPTFHSYRREGGGTRQWSIIARA